MLCGATGEEPVPHRAGDPRFLEVKTQHLLPRANDTHLGNGTAFWGSNEAAVINP